MELSECRVLSIQGQSELEFPEFQRTKLLEVIRRISTNRATFTLRRILRNRP